MNEEGPHVPPPEEEPNKNNPEGSELGYTPPQSLEELLAYMAAHPELGEEGQSPTQEEEPSPELSPEDEAFLSKAGIDVLPQDERDEKILEAEQAIDLYTRFLTGEIDEATMGAEIAAASLPDFLDEERENALPGEGEYLRIEAEEVAFETTITDLMSSTIREKAERESREFTFEDALEIVETNMDDVGNQWIDIRDDSSIDSGRKIELEGQFKEQVLSLMKTQKVLDLIIKGEDTSDYEIAGDFPPAAYFREERDRWKSLAEDSGDIEKKVQALATAEMFQTFLDRTTKHRNALNKMFPNRNKDDEPSVPPDRHTEDDDGLPPFN